MSWTAKLARVVCLSAEESEQIEAYASTIAHGSAGQPVFEGQMHSDNRGTVMATRAELLAHLALDADTLMLGLDPDMDLGVVDDAGRALAVCLGRSAVPSPELFECCAGRRVVLTGELDALWLLAEYLDSQDITLDGVAAVVDGPLLMPAAKQALATRLRMPVLTGVKDPVGGWLAIARQQDAGGLELVRGGQRLVSVDEQGSATPGAWGVLAIEREGELVHLPYWARVSAAPGSATRLECGVPPLPIPIADSDAGSLDEQLRLLPVFDYQLVEESRTRRYLLRVSPLPGEEARVRETLENADAEAGLLVEIEAAAQTSEGVLASSHTLFRKKVSMWWAGAEDSQQRRDAWREALEFAGAPGRTLLPVDARTGDALGAEFGDLCAAIVAARPPLALLMGSRRRGWELRIGDPREAARALPRGGWITLLPETETCEPILIAGVERSEVTAVRALLETDQISDALAGVTLAGVSLRNYSRPMVSGAGEGTAGPLWVDDSRCVGSGDCQRICPTGAIELRGVPARPQINAEACIKCQLCVERCEVSALRPVSRSHEPLPAALLAREAPKLAQLRLAQRARALEGKLVEPPAALDPRRAPATIKAKPTVVLGLATVTLMEHTAALLVDGELVSAIEEERLGRERHYTWRHPQRPGTSLSADECLRVEEAWPPRAIEAVLRTAGMTMDDVDVVALNGIPARFIESFGGGRALRPPPVLRANSMVFVPHHMAHAASVYGLSELDDAWILSVDGRGDYETATVWRAKGHTLESVDAVSWYPDHSFGGVYETVTRALGLGSHGQGSTMALAALGEPTVDVSSCMSMGANGRPLLSERAAELLSRPYARGYDDPLETKHYNLAASIQLALETTVGDYLAHHAGDLRGKNLALCGGVALNCRMNGVLRERFAPAVMHVPPGANDAGTAIGAALIGHRELTGELPRLGVGHTHFGPQWSDEAIASALTRMRVPFQRLRDVGEQTAELLEDGKIVCWFQGSMEFGPRALGGRSITADPRREALKDRLNAMKGRQTWRPFGSSVLAGRQSDWFVQDWDSRYMLFAVDVRPERRAQIPVVVHHDGSTRPQMVHAEHQPRYHALISAFERRTGVPMIVNTSFNRGGEPIVCNPAEAMRSFVGLGADAIVLGNCLVRRDALRRR